MAYCMYLRKSRRDYEAETISHEDTLARHRTILTDLARRNRHPIGEIYEEVVSADSIQSRPQMQRMIADLLVGKWQGVYVTAVDRLARGDTADQGYLMRVLQVSGVKVITPGKVLDPLNPEDETNVEFSMFLARQEYKVSTRRQQAGLKQSRVEGKFTSSRAPYGYRRYKLPSQRGWSLLIHQEEASVVRQIFSWYLDGFNGQAMGLTVISGRLSDIAAPIGENASVWSPSRVYRILTNPVYAGWVRYGYEKTQKSVTVSGVVKKRITNSDCELHRGLHDAIITQEQFDAVAARLHGYSKHLPVRKGAALANPLAGLVVCAECGHVLSHLPASGRQPAILKCRTRGCPTVQSYRLPVEEAVLSSLRSWLADAGRTSAPGSDPAPAPQLSAMDTMRAEHDKLLRQVDRLQDLLEQEVYTVDQYTQRYAKLRVRLDALDAEMRAEAERSASAPVYYTPQELAPAIVRLLEAYDRSTPQQKNDMLKTCISSVVYRKQKPGKVVRGKTYADPASFELDVFPLIKE